MAKKKIEQINAAMKYDGEGELLSDISSNKPLKKATKSKTTKVKKKQVKKKQNKKIVKKIVKEIKKENTEKELFNKILNSGEYFFLKYNNIIIYDSIKNKDSLLVFQDDYLILNNEIFSYTGLKIKFKK